MAKKDKAQYAELDLETGELVCQGCGSRITFLPAEHMPDAGPNTVNHAGCPAAGPDSSPAGGSTNIDGGVSYETINPVNRADVEAFYAAQKKKGVKILSETEAKGGAPAKST
jgi:hypothetical protein